MKKTFFLITFTFILFFFLFTTPCTAKQMNILVHPFENTGDKEYSWISAGMTDTVITDLTRIQNISVVSNQDRKKILEEMKFIFSGLVEEDRMMKLGKLTGANVIFTGSYLVSGSRIRVHARLVNVETGKVESSTKIDGTLNAIFDVQDKVVFTLMGETEKITIADIRPVKLTEQDRMKIEEKPKPKLTAYEWYAKGLEVQDTNPKEALTNFKKALDIDPNYTDALMEAGFTAGSTLNLFSEALGYLERAGRIFKGRNETKSSGYALLMMNIGIVYWKKGHLDHALEYYLNSQTIRDGLGLQNTADYAGLMMNIGNVYKDKSQLDRALEYYLNSQSIYDRLGLKNIANYALLMNNIGTVYQDKSQLDRALEYYLNSQSIYDRLGLKNIADYAGLMNNIGIVYKSKGQLDRALEYYLKDKSLEDRLGLQNTAGYASLMMSIGNVHKSKGQLDRALDYYLNSQTIRDRLGLQNTAGYAGLMNNMATLYEKQGQRDRALEYYLNTQTISDGLGLQNTADYAGLMMNMAVLYEKQGQRDMAGRYYRMAYDTFVRSDYSGEWKDKALNNAKRLGY
ncbi:MAG: tetratricopeptide repeat protein [Deltaproteobacteria bacterium]|nr:tetratricopeptide repeat protein [Deltaproteobacteria bacterium]